MVLGALARAPGRRRCKATLGFVATGRRRCQQDARGDPWARIRFLLHPLILPLLGRDNESRPIRVLSRRPRRIMTGTKTLYLGVAMFVCVSVPARAQHHGVHTASFHHAHGSGGHMRPSFGSPGLFLVGFGYGGWYAPPPFFMMNQGAFFPFGIMNPPPMMLRGPLLPPPPQGMMAPMPNPNVNAQRSDPVRSRAALMTLGDRLLRAGNVKKAEERYQQATRTAPDLAAPRVRLAQIAFVRGNYTDAALKFREAETAQPGWIITAPDIQSIYGEPTEFARHIAKLETHLQSHPDDRDAWLVLGAEWFLTGRTTKAADVFQRLNDPRRRPDVALAAFLDASNLAALRPGNPPDPPK